MAGYVRLPIVTDPAELQTEFFDTLMASLPGYIPSDGHLSTWIGMVVGRHIAENRTLVETVSEDIFRYFGKNLLAFPQIPSASATVLTNWTMIDTQGYTIPSGTVIGLRIAGDRLVAFKIIDDYVVSVGALTPAAGQIPVYALEVGEDANGIPAGSAELIDSLAFVSTITTAAATAGGVDVETDFDYLNRLRNELTLMSPRPILPSDFATLATRIAGVYRALAIDGYNATNATFNNERMITLAVASETGTALSTTIKNQLIAFLDAEREVNFVVHVIDPTYTILDITFSITTRSGFVPASVRIAAENAAKAFISPAAWGGGNLSPPQWTSEPKVRILELASVVYGVQGVDDVSNLLINGAGLDVTLTGVAPMPSLASTVVGTII